MGCAVQHNAVPVSNQDKIGRLRHAYLASGRIGVDDGGRDIGYLNKLSSSRIISVDVSISFAGFKQNQKYVRI